ncbi:kinase-like protein [Rhizophagus irregularis]|uniref:Kinase-like protein n=1 Tax=Rhizophagus irregularis TaxID=588596 RepID=A0A2N1NJJ0_9GLOM|nr:kinase-like protein [Rhizophagus irregularis]
MSSSSNYECVNWIEEAISNKYLEYYKFEEFKNIESVGTCDNVGTTYRANWKNWRQIFGLKNLFYINDTTVKELVNELKLHRKVDFHDNIINFYGVSEACSGSGIKKYLLVVDYADCGSLKQYLGDNFNKLTWKDKFQLAYQLTNVMSYLHYEGIVHRDLHSGNVLVHRGNIKLADLGLSRKLREAMSIKESIDLVPYIEPKRLADQKYPIDEKSDVYSIGVLLWEISSGKPPLNFLQKDGPYKLNSNFLALKIYQGQRENIVPGTPKDYYDLYQECWDGEPNERPTMIKVAEELKKIIMKCNLISNIIYNIYLITNLGKGKRFDAYVLNYFNDNQIEPKALYNWLLNNQPNSDSNFLLGYLYYYGIGVDASYEKAFNLFTSESNHTLALYYVGLCYQNGHGVEKNENSAFEYFEFLAKKNIAMGQVKIGYLYKRLKRDQDAIYWYKIAAENGNLMAMYNLANKYLGLEDYENAIKFLEKAAEGEYVEAINALGYCNENGLGTMINLKKAEELYTKAAKLGYSKSANNLGEMLFQDSDENKENLAQAIIWFKEAADLGDDVAHRNLKILSQNPSVLEDLKNLGEQGCKNSAIMILMGIP